MSKKQFSMFGLLENLGVIKVNKAAKYAQAHTIQSQPVAQPASSASLRPDVANAKPLKANAQPVVADAKQGGQLPLLEKGVYALIDPKGNILLDEISLQECMRRAPSLAKELHLTLRVVIPQTRRPVRKPVRKVVAVRA